jgi:phosphoribosylglycinamide formyltransferase 1
MSQSSHPSVHHTKGSSNLLILLSGGGRTMVNLHAHIRSQALNARITAVIASRPCPGMERALELGVHPILHQGVIAPDTLEGFASEAGADLIVLAGYLQRVIVPKSLQGKIVNIHPALLPSFGGKGMYGHHVHQAVLNAKCTISGCTVHLVDHEYDQGQILLQRSCPVLTNDTVDTLAARVFEQECIAYPQAINQLIASQH